MQRLPHIRSSLLVWFGLLVGTIFGWNSSCADDKTASEIPPAALKLYDALEEHTLPNGLRVFLLPVPGSPVVTTMTAYKVGSCDEDKSATGLSHYLEHLMFKGTAKLMPGDIDRQTQRSGGSNNAYTTEDMTNYHFDFAADRWETALDIEAERMRGLLIDAKHEFEQEKGAVIEELARNEDQPWDLEYKVILPLLFGKESPHGHPVIGERDHVRSATAGVIKNYYDHWYHPNNATLIVVGGIDPKAALEKIKAKFSDVPRGALPERKSWNASYPTRPARHEFTSKFPTARMLTGFVTIPQGHPDESALDLVSMILGAGKTSRLYQRLVMEERLAVDVSSSHNPGRYPGWLSINVELLPGKERAKAEKIVLEEVRKLSQSPPAKEELQRGKKLLLAQTMFQRESVHSLADNIARTVLNQPPTALKDQLIKWAAVTPEDVQRVAKHYLDADQSVIVWSVPPTAPSPGGSAANPMNAPCRNGTAHGYRSNQPFRGQATAPVGAAALSLKQAKQVTLPNGLTLLLMENHRLPIVVVATSLKHVRLHESAAQAGLAQLMGSALEEGTVSRTGQQIAQAIENVGGTLELSAGSGSIKVLTQDRHLGLDLLFDCLLHPSFTADAVTRKKEEQLAEIADAQEQPNLRAYDAFMETVYGKHFLGRALRGKRETVEKLQREDCVKFHQLIMTPDNMTVAIVGDFDPQEIIAKVTQLTENWQGRLPTPPPSPEPHPAAKSTTQFISMPNAAQLQFFMGHLGVKRDNPDYFKLLVMDYVLGTGTGFTDRLSARLRDREGLAYTVSANITETAGLEPGVFSCYIGTESRNFQRVKQIFIEEIQRLQREDPGEIELQGVKQYLLGRLAFTLTTNERIAGQLLMIHRYQLGFDYYEKYRRAISKMSGPEIRKMAEKYIHPDIFATMAAGAIDNQGKPLAPKGEK